MLRFASSAGGGGGAQSGLPVDGPAPAASNAFDHQQQQQLDQQQQQLGEPAAQSATATTAAPVADLLAATVEYTAAAQPPETCPAPLDVPAAVDEGQNVAPLSAHGRPNAAAIEAIDAVVADWADHVAAELIEGASIGQPEVGQPCVPAAIFPTALLPQPAAILPTALLSQTAETLPRLISPQPAAEAHRLVLDLLAEEVFDAERFWAIWQWQQWWQPLGGKRKSPSGAALPQSAADAAADWVVA